MKTIRKINTVSWPMFAALAGYHYMHTYLGDARSAWDMALTLLTFWGVTSVMLLWEYFTNGTFGGESVPPRK